MSGRLVPYISKAPPNFEEQIEEALQLKMFLISEKGPTSLIFTNEDETVIKMQIGLEVSCSCSSQKNKQCLHTLFALLKKFKVDKKSPMLWQGSYLDQEIEGLISGKYCEKKNSQTKRKYLQANSKFKNRPSRASQMQEEGENNFPQIEEGEQCPICYDDMTQQEPLTYCRKQCGKHFHADCLTIWCSKKTEKGNPTCPMCRCDLGSRALEEIKHDKNQFKYRNEIHIGKKCRGCGKKPIQGSIYHCLFCENYDLCNLCYQGFTHMQHNNFLTKTNKNEEWKLAKPRDVQKYQMSKNKLFIQNTLKYNDLDEMLPNRLNQEQNSNQQITEEKLVDCFKTLQDMGQQQQKLNDLQIIGLDVKQINVGHMCISCNKQNQMGSNMKRLQCGHAIDQYCLFQLFKNKKYFCPQDGFPLLPGYNSANGIEYLTNQQQLLKNQQEKIQKKISNQNNISNSDSKKNSQVLGRLNRVNTVENQNLGLDIGGQQNFSLISQNININNKKLPEINQSNKKYLQKGFNNKYNSKSQQTQRRKLQQQQQNNIENLQFTLNVNPIIQSQQEENNNISSVQSQQQQTNNQFQIKKHNSGIRKNRGNNKPPLASLQQQQNVDFNIVGGGIQINQTQSQQQQQQLSLQDNNSNLNTLNTRKQSLGRIRQFPQYIARQNF